MDDRHGRYRHKHTFPETSMPISSSTLLTMSLVSSSSPDSSSISSKVSFTEKRNSNLLYLFHSHFICGRSTYPFHLSFPFSYWPVGMHAYRRQFFPVALFYSFRPSFVTWSPLHQSMQYLRPYFCFGNQRWWFYYLLRMFDFSAFSAASIVLRAMCMLLCYLLWHSSWFQLPVWKNQWINLNFQRNIGQITIFFSSSSSFRRSRSMSRPAFRNALSFSLCCSKIEKHRIVQFIHKNLLRNKHQGRMRRNIFLTMTHTHAHVQQIIRNSNYKNKLIVTFERWLFSKNAAKHFIGDNKIAAARNLFQINFSKFK